jgi:probable F420-dependent oxidoreductase
MSAPAVGVVAGTTRDALRRLEAAGATSLWVGGHVASPNPTPEPIVWLARLIEQTTLPVGTGVVLLPLYQPAVLAKQLADLDRASGGRISVGIGVGGEYDSDFRAAGVPVQERGTRTDEAIGLLRRFWNGEPVDHRGQHYSYDDVRIHPAPHRPGGPPILVAGRKPPAMRRAARLGDGWMPYLYSPRAYERSVEEIRHEAEVVGRALDGFRWIAYVAVAVDDDRQAARRAAATFLGGVYSQDFDPIVDRVTAAGAPDDVVRRLQELLDAGAEELIILPCGADPTAVAERVLTEIVPRLRTTR